MQSLRLKIRDGCEEPYVEFYVDDKDLGALVVAAFVEDGFDDDVLPWHGIDFDRSETVLGVDVGRRGSKYVILFACGCGLFGCGSVWADVAVSEESVTLSNISTWRGGRRHVATLEPIAFERGQFAAANRQLERDIDAWHPPQKTEPEKAPPILLGRPTPPSEFTP